MKKKKDGSVKLERGESRVGNFIYKEENGHFKVRDLGDTFSLRIGTGTAAGQFWALLRSSKTEGAEEFTKAWTAVLWSAFAVVPDSAFLEAVQKAAEECMRRHADIYGVKENASEKEDEAAIEEMKGMQQMDEEVKNLPEK